MAEKPGGRKLTPQLALLAVLPTHPARAGKSVKSISPEPGQVEKHLWKNLFILRDVYPGFVDVLFFLSRA